MSCQNVAVQTEFTATASASVQQQKESTTGQFEDTTSILKEVYWASKFVTQVHTSTGFQGLHWQKICYRA